MLLKFTTLSARTLLLVAFIFVGLSASHSQSLPSSFENYNRCNPELPEECEALFQIALQEVNALPLDSSNAALKIRLAEIRKDVGFWDDQVEKLFDGAIGDFKELSNPCGESMAIKSKSSFFIYNEENDKALELINQAFTVAEECQNDAVLAELNSTKSVVLVMRGEFAKALEYSIASLELFEKIEDLEGKAVCLQEMGNIYGSMGDKANSKKYMLEAAEIYNSIGKEMRYAACMTDLCALFLENEEPDSVLHYMPSIFEIFSKNNYVIGEAVATYNIGDAHQQLGNCSEALIYYDKSAKLVKNTGFLRLEFEIELSRSSCETDLGNHQAAFDHVLKAQELAEASSSAEGLMNIKQFLMHTAHEVGEHELSYQSAEEFIALKDSLLSNTRKQEVAVLQEKFESEKKLREIESLKSQKEREQLEKKGLWIILILILISALIIINRERKRRQKSKELFQSQMELKEEKELRLKEELATKNRELSAKALHIAQKNEVLQQLKSELESIASKQGSDQGVREAVNTLKLDKVIDGNWQQFTQQFTELNPDFYKRINSLSPDLTKSDLRLAALLRMNLNSKEIASLLNISNDGVKKARQRFRKKLSLQTEDNLESFITSI